MSLESELAEDVDPAKPMRLVYALLLSLPLFGAGFVIEQTIRWTNHLDGLMSGLIHLIFFSIGAAIYLIPWALIVHFSFRKRANQKRRTLWMLGPSILMCLLSISSLVTNPPTPRHRFKQLAKADLPAKMESLNYHFSGGGLADYHDTYYFKTSPTEVDRLIREMGLEEDEFYGDQSTSHTIISPLPGSPDFKKWPGHMQFRGGRDEGSWHYYLITDKLKTQVYINVGCI
jgi:hypothetical protein